MESSESSLAFKGKELECFGARFSHPLRTFNSQTAEDANRICEAAGSVKKL